MNAQKNARLKCRKIYKDAQAFFDKIPRPHNYGFKILYGPPFFQPPILFIGYQPGGDDDDWEREAIRQSDKRWPAACEYATESWKLAKVLRQMFGRAFLERCVGINAIFLRSPTVTDYNRTFDKKTRAQIKAFCLASVVDVVEAIAPKKIVAIGFDTLRLFGPAAPDLLNEKKELVLTRIGQIADRPAIGTLHLTGARISKLDRILIKDRVLVF